MNGYLGFGLNRYGMRVEMDIDMINVCIYSPILQEKFDLAIVFNTDMTRNI
jgi:hypothetical protein